MKNRDLLIAEAVRNAVLEQVGDYYLDTCPASQVKAHVSIDIPAIIASVPAPEPVAWRVMIRRADTEWRLYALYENEKSANATRLKIEGDPLQVNVQPVYAAPRASWYFARLEPSGTIIAVEPDGTEHVVKNGDTNTEAARQLLNAMMRDLT